MHRLAGPIITSVLALANTQAHAQAGAAPISASQQEAAKPAAGEEQTPSKPVVAGNLCSTLEQAATEN